MSRVPFPNIREVSSEVMPEESRRYVMMNDQSPAPSTLESSTLNINAYESSSSQSAKRNNRPWCDHCQRLGHTRNKCWKIHGKPLDWKSSKASRDGKALNTTVSDSSKPIGASSESKLFTKEQLEQLISLINSSQLSNTNNIPSTSLTKRGNI